MKRFYLIFTAILFLNLHLQAQTPNALSYQGVARDAAGLVLSNKPIGLRFTIHQGNANGTIVYQETQSTTTNLLGLFTVAIGNGTIVTGSFSGIGWGSNKEYLQVEMDATGGTSYLNMGTNEFLSVPYAVTAGSSTSSWNLTGNSSTNGTDYIGTTDANDLIIKAHNNEVMRIANSANNVGIGTSTPDPGAVLDVTSSTKGFLIPRMASDPANPVQGMMYYNTTTGCFLFYTGTLWEPIVCPCPNPIGTPGPISGITTFCPNVTGVSYSVAPVANAISYAWTIPVGVGTIASGAGSNAITVNMASSSGTITVAAVNSCGAGNVSSLPLIGATLPNIATSPASAPIISTATGTFTVVATGTGLTYQWQVSTDNGATYNPVSNGGVYSNATTATLTITNPDISMNGYKYEVVVTGVCGTPQTSAAATLTVCPGAVTTPGTIVGTTPFCPSATGLVYSVPAETFATSYAWTFPSGFTTVSGGTTNIITVNAGTSSGNITVKAINACATSSTTTLSVTVGAAPAITALPANVSVNAPTNTSFSVTATGGGLSYQWKVSTDGGATFTPLTNTAPYSNVTTNVLNITSPTVSLNGNQYEVAVSNSCGSPVTSRPAILTVCAGALGTISTPTGTTPVCPSTNVVYSVPLVTNATSYSWSVPATLGTIIAGAGTNTITVTTINTGGNIAVTALNACSSTTSGNKAVTFSTGPAITVQPKNTSVVNGSGTATFSVTVSGSPTYVWQVSTDNGVTYNPVSNGGVYSTATTATLTITNPPVGMNGYLYRVVATTTGTCPSATSTSAALGVCATPSVQIAVTNKSTVTTPANFVVQVPINFSLYTTFGELSNLTNIEFTANASAASSGTPLYAWIENGSAASTTAATTPTSASTAPVVWVNLGATTIPAGGTIYLYLNFMGSAVMVASTTGVSTGFTGMAPQFTGATLPTYGQYDNGALVFPFYDNFAGTTLNAAKWTSFHSGAGSGTVAVSNKIVFTTSNGGTETNVITSTSTFTNSFFAEMYVFTTSHGNCGGQRSYMPGLTMMNAATEGTNIADNGTNNFPNDYSMSFCFGRNGLNNTQYATIQGDAPAGHNAEVAYTAPTPATVMILGYNLGGTNIWNINYSGTNTASSASFPPTGNLYYAIGTMNQGGTTNTFSAYWSRIRPNIPVAAPVAPTVAVVGTGCF